MRTPKRVLPAAAMALVAAAAPAHDAPPPPPPPSIELVTPIDAGPVQVVSDEPVFNSDGFLFLAWSAPGSGRFSVEFELAAPGFEETLTTVEAVSTVWGARWDIPESAPEGRYVVTARLLDDGQAVVATDQADVVVVRGDDQGQASSALHLNRNVPSGHGFYDPPGRPPGTQLTFYGSEGAEQVRGFYSTTRRPQEPVWKACGHVAFGELYKTPYAPLRCSLQPGDSPEDVTLVGGIANETPAGEPPDPALDGSGMAVMAYPYVVRAPRLWLSYSDSHEGHDAPCNFLVIRTRDRRENPVWSVPVDLHLSGPRQVSFGDTPDTARLRSPRDGHGPAEDVSGCAGDVTSSQAFHGARRYPVHAELAGGTSRFEETVVGMVRADRAFVRAWIDADADDRFDSGETTDVLMFPSDPTISMRVIPRSPRRGSEVRLSGSLDGAGTCGEWRGLVLQARWGPETRWKPVEESFTGQFGDYVVPREIHKPVSLRLVTGELNDLCGRARSRAVRIVPR